MKVLFLDRDGVINKDLKYVCKKEDFYFKYGIFKLLKKASEQNYKIIIITNQAGIGRGFYSEDEFWLLMDWVLSKFLQKGISIEKVYFCPHHPESGFKGEVIELKIDCECRKPNTGMIKKAVKDLNIDLQKSYLIGDTTSDIKTGEKMGLKTILVKTGYSGRDEKYIVNPNYHCDNLLEGVKKILKL